MTVIPEPISVCWSDSTPSPTVGAASARGRWVALDGALFNRAALDRDWGLGQDPALDDAAWLLAALRARGTTIFEALDGAYALVAWDGEALWMARDAMGQVPLHVRVASGHTAVATWPRTLAGESARVDRAALVDFALLLDDDPVRSFFADVRKLAPGEIAVSRAPGTLVTAATYRPRLAHRRIAFDEAREETRRLVDAAVRDLAGDGARTALSLSSGLDSNILLASLARQAMPALAIAAGPEGDFDPQDGHVDDERPIARAAAEASGIAFCAVDGPASALADLPAWFARCERPYYNPGNFGWLDAVAQAAAKGGRETLLNGLAGNFTVTWTGDGAASGAWFGRDPAGVAGALASAWQAGTMREALRTLASDHAPAPLRRLRARQQRERFTRLGRLLPSPLVSGRIERAIAAGAMPHRWNDRIAAPRTRLRSHVAGIDFGPFNKGFERLAGVRTRDPLGQRALAEWCVSLPPAVYAAGGETRRLGRALLAPEAPRAVREQATLAVQGANWRRAMERDLPLARQWIARARDHDWLAQSFDLDWLDRVITSWPTSGWANPAYQYDYRVKPQRLLTALGFALWVEGA